MSGEHDPSVLQLVFVVVENGVISEIGPSLKVVEVMTDQKESRFVVAFKELADTSNEGHFVHF